MHSESMVASRPAHHGRSEIVRLALRLAVLGSVAVSLAGCGGLDALNIFGGEKYETKLLPDVPADDIYDQALARIQRKDYEGAAKKFGELEKQYPYSQWSRRGLLMTVYSQFENGNYDDAIGSAQRYISLYPTSPDTPYVYYLAGMSHYNLIPDISRDQERAEKSLRYFTDLVQKYPKSEYVEDARYKIQVTRDQLAGKEMSIGRFYLQRKNYPAAVNRFREVLAKYQTTRHTEEALYRLTEAYLAMGVSNEAQTAAAVLGHNYPDSQWYKDAYGLLKGGGLEPSESNGSWISRTFKKVGLG